MEQVQGQPALLTEFKGTTSGGATIGRNQPSGGFPNKQLASFKTNVRAAGADTRSFGDELKNALAKFGLWITASSIFMQAWRGMRQMVDSVKELDAALVEFNKVADLSSSQLEKFVDRAFEAGEALGTDRDDWLKASRQGSSRQGYNVDESLALAQTSLMMMNVGDGIDTAERAASDLIAALKGSNLKLGNRNRFLTPLIIRPTTPPLALITFQKASAGIAGL